jgi:ribosomal protein L31E
MTNNERIPVLEVPVTITVNDKHPYIELRKAIRNLDLVKLIIYKAMRQEPVIIQPSFTNKTKSLCSLVERGLIYN